MIYKDYRDMIKDMPYTETLEYKQAIMWLHPENLPLGVFSIGEEYPTIIKIPPQAVNRYGRKVPIIAIARDAFAGHGEITDIVLPPSIQGFAKSMFSGCSGLKRITIPKKIKTISRGMFDGCDALEDVYYEGSMEEWKRIKIVHHKQEIELGSLIPGTPVQKIEAQRLIHIPGNDALLTAKSILIANFQNWLANLLLDQLQIVRILLVGFRTMKYTMHIVLIILFFSLKNIV